MKIQNKKEFMKLLSIIPVFIFIFLFSYCGPKQKPRTIPENLVWPSPPDVSRIKLIGSIRSEEDIGGPKKKSLKDILLGRDVKKDIKKIKQPYGICVDDNERIFVADSGQGKVLIFDMKNGKMEFIGDRGRGRLAWPIDVVLDNRHNIYVSDARHANVLIYDQNGEFKHTLAKKGTFINPSGLAHDRQQDRILVVDTKAHDVKVFSADGKLATIIGKRGVGEGQFNFPTNAVVGNDGYIYVVDSGNHRVQVFDKNLEYYDDFGTLGRHPGQFRRPRGIALDSDNHIYVVDGVFNNFQIFSQEYMLLLHVGRYGRDFGQFWLPSGIHIDRDDKVYVVDTMNKRIQVFQYMKQKE